MKPIALPYGPPTVDLAGMRYLAAVAAAGSMTRAAKLLRISQPTLSVAMRNLEARLGTALLLRGPAGVVLTGTGEELVRSTRELFDLVQRTVERIRGLETEEVGRFAIGCYHSFGAYFLPEPLGRLAAEAPGIELGVWHGTADDVRNAVVDRAVQFGVAVSPRPHPDLVLVELFRDVMAVFVAARARRAAAAGPLLFVERILTSQQVVEGLRGRGALPARLLPCGDLEIAKSLALHGVGAAVLPHRVAGYNLPRGALRLLDPKLPFAVDTAYLMYRADLHRTRAALRVKEALLARGRELDRSEALPLGVRPVGRRPLS
jgi:DNA-binding transcriptional LysR family regulator